MHTTTLSEQIQRLNKAQRHLAIVPSSIRSSYLTHAASLLESQSARILEANAKDIHEAGLAGISGVLVKRLKFDEEKLKDSCRGIRQIASMADPLGVIALQRELDQGLILTKQSTPIGVIGMIFESRPDALLQIAALCVKSGNAVVLKGGSEALHTNRVLTDILKQASRDIFPQEVSDHWIHLLENRQEVSEILGMHGSIDLIIPRGSNEFVSYIMQNTSIPVLGHADGICHCYIDKKADPQMAIRIAVDSKCQYPAACNSIETILIHEEALVRVIGPLSAALSQRGVSIRGDETVRQFIDCQMATESDWSTEYLDLIVSIKTVRSVTEAIDHINTYGSSHTDTIVTEDRESAELFTQAVDSADVYWNCSTRFADGYRYGLGAEVGISTHKIHARGPVGLEGLISWKWILRGDGQIVADYSGPDARSFTHRDLNS